MIMVFPGHTYLLFWSEWDSDLRSSTPQSRTLTTRQRRFLYLVVFCFSSSRYLGGLVSDLRSSATQSRTLSTRQRRFLYLVVFCVSSSWYHGGLVSDLRSSTPQSKALTTRQRRFSYLAVFCVSSSWYHGGLVCDNGISWLYSFDVLVPVGIRPAIFCNSVKDSNH